MSSYGKLGLEAPRTETAFRRDWISETFTVSRDQLVSIIALHLDFGILPQKSFGKLLGTSRLVRLKDLQVDANKRAVFFLNYISEKHANPKLQDLTVKYFVMDKSLRGYARPEVGKLPHTSN